MCLCWCLVLQVIWDFEIVVWLLCGSSRWVLCPVGIIASLGFCGFQWFPNDFEKIWTFLEKWFSNDLDKWFRVYGFRCGSSV